MIPETTSTPTPTSAAKATRQPDTTLSADYQTFLKMLTTQMRNQDPLNPVDATEFTSQLATFSALEQQVIGNSHLSTIASLLGSGGFTVADLLGNDVVVEGAVDYTGAALDLVLQQATTPGDVLEISNQAGDVIGALPLFPDQDQIRWEGRTADGTQLPPGTYSFAVVPANGGVGQAVSLLGTVDEVRTTGTGRQVVLSSGQTVAATAVSALRPGP